MLSGCFIDFRSHNEITLGQAVDFVRPDLHADLSPGKVNIRMVPLLFCNRANIVRESQRSLEIRELEFPLDMMVVHDCPICHFRRQRPDLLCIKRRHSAAARYAGLFRKSHNQNLLSGA